MVTRPQPTLRLTPAPPAASPGTLLVGTALSVRQAVHALAVADPAPDLLGCLLPEGSEAPADLGCPALGRLGDLPGLLRADRPDQVLISLPLSMSPAARAAATACERAGVAWRFLPTLSDQLAGRIQPQEGGQAGGHRVLGSVDPAQLIDRQPRPLDEGAIAACLAGATVLITGAGGSIGSELARIACRFGPAKIVLVERGENALFEIDREIARIHPTIDRAAELHDVTNPAATLELFRRHRPDAVFHAAAHKHVPMMEDHPSAAVENNFLGTRSVADAADATNVGRFVMISTDKAVNPSSVMGATKRLAELYVQHLAATAGGRTVYSMVRFGNVLGSACSVLPIWTEQLARGGPITVTHPDMTRYFMTIPEAAGLVLQAGALAGSGGASHGGEVFLLDMGEPVRILGLAERFARLHGFEPGSDVRIDFTGVRPGEKLFEELAYDGEDMIPTPHASIRIWRTTPPDAARIERVASTFDRLRNRGASDHPWAGATREQILTTLRAAVPEMVSAAAG